MNWMTAEEDVWPVAEYLTEIPHIALLSRTMERALNRMDARLEAAGKLGGV
jgi:hypothetical protein